MKYLGRLRKSQLFVSVILCVISCKTKDVSDSINISSQATGEDYAELAPTSTEPYNSELPIIFIPENILDENSEKLSLTGGGGILASVAKAIMRVHASEKGTETSLSRALNPSHLDMPTSSPPPGKFVLFPPATIKQIPESAAKALATDKRVSLVLDEKGGKIQVLSVPRTPDRTIQISTPQDTGVPISGEQIAIKPPPRLAEEQPKDIAPAMRSVSEISLNDEELLRDQEALEAAIINLSAERKNILANTVVSKLIKTRKRTIQNIALINKDRQLIALLLTNKAELSESIFKEFIHAPQKKIWEKELCQVIITSLPKEKIMAFYQDKHSLSLLPNELLILSPKLLDACLERLPLTRIEELLTLAPAESITAALLHQAKKPLSTSEIVRASEPTIADFKPLEDFIDLKSKKSIDDLLEAAYEQGKLSLPFKESRRPIDFSFLNPFLDRPVEELFREFELLKIGESFSKDLSPQNLAGAISAFRALISEKISLLSADKRAALQPQIYLFKRSASVAEFSNSLAFAHRLGIRGKGTRISVIEDLPPGIKEQEIGKHVTVRGSFSENSGKNADHGFHVVGILQQVSPDATVEVRPEFVSYVFESTDIINLSNTLAVDFSLTLSGSSGLDKKLVIGAAGNNGKFLNLELATLSAAQKGQRILTGNLQAGNNIAPSSNMPGEDPLTQDLFLWTLGSDVLSMTGPENFGRMSGTSMSAPVVSGAAAVLKSRFPKLTAAELKECLLESADRDFWIEQPGLSIHVIEPGKPGDLAIIGDTGVATWPFDRRIFGKGLLNLRRALDYAYLKQEVKLGTKAIRKSLEVVEKKAATTIQRWFKESYKRKATVL